MSYRILTINVYIIYVSQGEDSVEYFLGLAPSGLLLLRGKHTVANYYWPRVSKLYYKGRYFMLRVADKNVRKLFYCSTILDNFIYMINNLAAKLLFAEFKLESRKVITLVEPSHDILYLFYDRTEVKVTINI